MKIHFHHCLWIAMLLISCDKTKDSGQTEGETGPRSTHANRSQRDSAGSLKEKFRAALNAAMKIEDPAARDQALAAVVRDALKSAPEISTEAFKQISPDSKDKTQLLQDCAKLLVETKPEQALAWAETLGLAKDITAAKIHIARLLADSDPADAMNSLTNSGMELGKPGSIAATIALRRWASKAPANAAAWAIARPPGESRKAGIKDVVSPWIQADPKAAFSWVANLNNDADRQDASRAMAEAIVQIPPLIRDSVLASADPAIRSELQQQVDQITKEAEEKLQSAPEIEPK